VTEQCYSLRHPAVVERGWSEWEISLVEDAEWLGNRNGIGPIKVRVTFPGRLFVEEVEEENDGNWLTQVQLENNYGWGAW